MNCGCGVNVARLLAEPAFCHIPPYDSTDGPIVADLARLAGLPPDPEQCLALDAIFAQAGGRSAAFEIALITSRQNIKTATFKMAALGWLFITGERLIVWSAHEFPTAAEAFRDLDDLITGCDYLRREVKAVYRGNGDESIELLSGARLIFKTRTKGGGRGLSGRKVILDEGFALRPMHMGALLPTLSAQPDPQVLYGSSAGLADSDVLRGVRDRGRPGTDPRLAWIEFCAPPPAQVCAAGDGCTHALGTPGCGCDDPRWWQAANPALGRRITAEYVAAERRALPPAEFARERMGWWDDPGDGGTPVTEAMWRARADPRSVVADPVALAFAVTPGGSSSAVAVGGRRPDGLGHGELIDHRPGTGWLMGRVRELADRHQPCVTVLNPAGAAGAFEAELIEHGWSVKPGPGERRLMVVGAREYAHACGALADDVVNGRWRHLGQAPLDDAVKGARTRDLADAWAWSWKLSAADIAPLEAVTLARHGFMTHGVNTGQFFASWR
jgi:hypothetical protein